MPEFVHPFPGMVPRKMDKEELLRALRLNIAAELEAVHLYMAHAQATDDPLAKKVLVDIAEEEIVHAGEFQTLLAELYPQELEFLKQGQQEVMEMKAQLGGEATPAESVPPTTVGNLR